MQIKNNKIRSVVSYSAAVIMFLFIFAVSYGYSAEISFMGGDVKVIRGNKEMKAGFQMKLITGDIVKTGKLSFADVSYEGGTVIKIRENSTVTIGNKSITDSDTMSVNRGIISAKFAKIEKGPAGKIYTPTTVCAVRGTEFEVAVSESADSKVQLNQGLLDILNSYGSQPIKEDQGAEIGLGEGPVKTQSDDLKLWQEGNEAKLESNPEEQSDAFEKYLRDSSKRSEDTSQEIKKLENKKSTTAMGGKEKMEQANTEIESLHSSVEDDLYMSSAADNSIDGILNRFGKDKKDIYDNFLRIKKESNKVLEQQKKNYEAIAAIKEAYRKAYEDIMQKHKEAVDKIRQSTDTEQYKPKK